jgi:hypothetical protein
MTDGCKHIPPVNLAGYDVSSFVSGPHCTSVCELTKPCDSSHVFVVGNFHLYDVGVTIDASSYRGSIEVCDEAEDAAKRTKWRMTGKVPPAPYRPPKNALPYSQVRLSTNVHSVLEKSQTENDDNIEVDYSIDSPVNGLMKGMGFTVLVELS